MNQKMMAYWCLQLLNMFIQGATKDGSPIVLAMACLVWPALAQSVVAIYKELYDIPIPKNKTFIYVGIFSFFWIIVGFYTGLPFSLYSIIPILFVAGLTYHCSWKSYKYVKTEPGNHYIDYAFLFFNVAYVLHSMSYPFTRLDPDQAYTGLFIHMSFSMTFAILLPAVILKKMEVIHNMDLRKRVEDQSIQLINETKSNALGSFSSEIAHQINNPLTVALGKIRMAIRDNEKVNIHNKNLDGSYDAIKKASDIIHAIKKFSTVLESEENKTNLIDLIESFSNSVELPLQKSNIKLIKNFDSNKILIHCPKSVVIQLILSLYNNSVDALNKSKEDKWIEISVKIDSNRVFLNFIDSAGKISKSDREKIFSPFYTTKRTDSARGLSLSTTKLTLSQYDANIKLLDEPVTNFECSFEKLLESIKLG
jgi:signal transduction histidine kinase